MDEHTLENPYCGNLSCWCHSNSSYHATVHTLTTHDETAVPEALDFFEIGEQPYAELAFVAVE